MGRDTLTYLDAIGLIKVRADRSLPHVRSTAQA